MSTAEPRRSELLIEHCASLDPETSRSSYERLEDVVGGQLAQLLLGALTGSHAVRSPHVDGEPAGTL